MHSKYGEKRAPRKRQDDTGEDDMDSWHGQVGSPSVLHLLPLSVTLA